VRHPASGSNGGRPKQPSPVSRESKHPDARTGGISTEVRLVSSSDHVGFEGDDLTSATRLAEHVQERPGTLEPPLV
jgi:hypothetical protein